YADEQAEAARATAKQAEYDRQARAIIAGGTLSRTTGADTFATVDGTEERWAAEKAAEQARWAANDAALSLAPTRGFRDQMNPWDRLGAFLDDKTGYANKTVETNSALRFGYTAASLVYGFLDNVPVKAYRTALQLFGLAGEKQYASARAEQSERQFGTL